LHCWNRQAAPSQDGREQIEADGDGQQIVEAQDQRKVFAEPTQDRACNIRAEAMLLVLINPTAGLN
jgi:hypothetical protein